MLIESVIRTSLIIWGEVPMEHKHAFKSLDRRLRDMLGFKDEAASTKLFGGKTMLFGGDFRQVLSIVTK